MADLKLDTGNIPLIKGSTLDIWRALYINVMDVKTVNVKDPIVGTLLATDVKIAQQKDVIAEPFEAEEHRALIPPALKTLTETAATSEIKRLTQDLSDSFQLIKPKVDELIKTRVDLLAEYKQIVREQNLTSKEILDTIKANRTVDKNKVQTIQNKEQIFKDKVDTAKDEAETMRAKLEEIYTNIFKRIPEPQRTDLPAPEEIQKGPAR